MTDSDQVLPGDFFVQLKASLLFARFAFPTQYVTAKNSLPHGFDGNGRQQVIDN
jgi:hypothetical protein